MNTAIKTDNEGFLANHKEWSEDFVKEAAMADDIEITSDHMTIINYMHDYYDEFGVSPPVRKTIKKLSGKLERKLDDQSIYDFFPLGPKQAVKLAGLPKPTGCF